MINWVCWCRDLIFYSEGFRLPLAHLRPYQISDRRPRNGSHGKLFCFARLPLLCEDVVCARANLAGE
jgi:hypothetical protein